MMALWGRIRVGSSSLSYLSTLALQEGAAPLPYPLQPHTSFSSAALRLLPGSSLASQLAQIAQPPLASATGTTSMAQAVSQSMLLPFQFSRQASGAAKNKDENKGKNPPPSPETLRRFAVERSEYREQMSVLRKQYASEHAERLRNKEKLQKAKRDLRKLEQVSEVEARKEQEAARRTLLAEQQVELRKAKEEQRKRNEEWRLQMEARVQEKRALALEKLAKESKSWVRDRDLDRRINEAFDDPYKLHAK